MVKANFIAVGQCGGNIGKLLEEQGLKGLYLNSSLEDLETLDVENKYCIAGADGCNKNRKKAKMYVQNDVNNILERIKKSIDSEIVFIIGSAGGGTGSGSLPVLCDVVSRGLNKIVCAVSVLPGEHESVQAHINTYEVIKELSQVEKLGAIFLIDNNKNVKKLELNTKFANHLKTLLSVSEHKSVDGNIDNAEIKNFLQTKGFCTMAKEKKEGAKIFAKLKESDIFANIEVDKVISYAIISTNSNITEKDITSNFGVTRDIYKNKQDKHNFIALAGLSLPLKRLEEVKNRLNKDKDEVLKNREAVKNSFKLFDDGSDFDFGFDDDVLGTEVNNDDGDIKNLADDLFGFLMEKK